jgi:hypothetical protein
MTMAAMTMYPTKTDATARSMMDLRELVTAFANLE